MTVISSRHAAPSPHLRMREALVRIEHLTKSFPVRRRMRHILLQPFRTDYTRVIQDLTCEIGRGEFFGLLGPNGAGKTTLFKILATLILPDEGHATVAGYDIVQQPSAVRRVLAPVIADERSLYWRLSARENLKLYAVLQGLDGRMIQRRVEEVLDVVGLEDTGNKIVGQFSSGMKQRLLIGRALLAHPQVLLLDEPTRSLDPVSARRFRRFLREEIQVRHGCTILLATHNTEEALELCDRVAVLDRGRLLAVGTADELSREIMEEKYRIWTRVPDHSAFAALAARGLLRQLGADTPDAAGWTPLRVEIPGGADAAADVISFLALQGVPVARFERIPVGLADVIESVVHRARGEAAHA